MRQNKNKRQQELGWKYWRNWTNHTVWTLADWGQ